MIYLNLRQQPASQDDIRMIEILTRRPDKIHHWPYELKHDRGLAYEVVRIAGKVLSQFWLATDGKQTLLIDLPENSAYALLLVRELRKDFALRILIRHSVTEEIREIEDWM